MMRKSMSAGFIALALVIAIALFYLATKDHCKTYYQGAALAADGQKSSTLYLKQCGAVTRGVAEKEYSLVVMRPVSEPPPADNRFDESDLVFEIEGERTFGLGGSPSSYEAFRYLPKQEQENSVLIECQYCAGLRILKKSHQWRGIPIHYYFSNPSGTNPTIE